MLTNSGDYFDIVISDSAKASVGEGRCGWPGDRAGCERSSSWTLKVPQCLKGFHGEMRSHKSASAVREMVAIYLLQCQLGYYVEWKEEGI